MAKRRAGNPTSDSRVRHSVGKLSRRATTLVQTSSWSDSAVGSYEFPKSWGSNRDSFGTISELQLRSPGKKSHMDVASVESCRVYYKGEGGGFPQVQAMVSLVCPCCSWFVLAPKVLQLCTNNFVWVLCRLVWVSKACQIFLVPSRSSSTPLYPSKCRELGSVPRLLVLPLFSYLGPHLGLVKSWECVNWWLLCCNPLVVIDGYFINGYY
jgi:hypothetical protein